MDPVAWNEHGDGILPRRCRCDGAAGLAVPGLPSLRGTRPGLRECAARPPRSATEGRAFQDQPRGGQPSRRRSKSPAKWVATVGGACSNWALGPPGLNRYKAPLAPSSSREVHAAKTPVEGRVACPKGVSATPQRRRSPAARCSAGRHALQAEGKRSCTGSGWITLWSRLAPAWAYATPAAALGFPEA